LQVPPSPPNKTILGEPIPPPNKTMLGTPEVQEVEPVVRAVALPLREVEPAEERDRGRQSKRRRRRRDSRPRDDWDECPFCGSKAEPYSAEEISQTGWVLFVVLIFLFLPLCWLGLFMKDCYLECPDCGERDKVSTSFKFG
jgi:hypothetical protein